jgi:hypothetical protein
MPPGAPAPTAMHNGNSKYIFNAGVKGILGQKSSGAKGWVDQGVISF